MRREKSMKRAFGAVTVCLILFAGLFALASSDRFNEYVGTAFGGDFFSDQFALGKILSIKEEIVSGYDDTYPAQTMQVRFITGPNRGGETTLRNTGTISLELHRSLHPNEIIVIGTNIDFEGDPYYFSDRFRLPALLMIALAFFAAVLFVARLRGFTALVGLAVTAFILLSFIIPRILQGHSSLLTILVGTFIIAITSLYLAHGFNRQTSVAVLGTLITLALSLGLSILSVRLTNVIGLASKDVFYLKLGLNSLNVTGLLLGSILIGALGVLDDVTIGQSATVAELRRANPNLTLKDLYLRGMAVGREHIASLVNTLVLAYAGTSFPLLLLFILNKGVTPFWAILNGEVIAEEIVRTVAGSLTLVLAVPITTLLAAYFLDKRKSAKG
jgi:uncharacterized membrane protein